MMFQVKRIYETPEPKDGYRVLVDRLWPRGVSKDKAQLDEWFKDIAPSSELRTWFGHKPERFNEFKLRYEAELDNNPVLAHFKTIADHHDKVTLLYAARDEAYNHARVLMEYLNKHLL